MLEPGLTKSLIGLATVSTDNAVVKFSGTTGNTQNSGVIVDISNNVTGVAALTASGVVMGLSLRATGLTSGRVPFATTGGAITDSANIATDSAGARLLIGAPTDDGATRLQVNGAGAFAGQLAPTTDNTRTLGTAALQWSDVRSVLGNFSGDITITRGAADAQLDLRGNSGYFRGVVIRTNGASRWFVAAGIEAESGSNVGSDYSVHRYTDAGAYLGTALTVTRSNGNAAFEAALTAGGLITASGGITVASAQALTLGNTAVAATPTATHTMTIKDAAGTTYRVLCVV